MNSFEKIAREDGYHFVAYINAEINDSKRLSASKREKLYGIIEQDAVAVGMRVIDADVIDHVNILQASLGAMREAVLELSTSPDFLLVDGIHRIPIITPQKPLIKGDSLSVSIAAASIIAKVTRDRIMEMYHRQFPQYNFRKNKGYGTKEHIKAIREFGVCKIHRKSFHVKNLKQACFDFHV